jgi:hypothetical protein
MKRQGDYAKGARNGNARLSEAEVHYIRACPNEKPIVLAAYLGVSESAIQHVRKGRAWSHVT